MKKIVQLIGLFTLLTTALHGQQIIYSPISEDIPTVENTAKAGGSEIQMGYCLNSMTGSVGLNSRATIQCGILFTDKELENYAGSSLKKIALGIANYPTPQAKIFLAGSVGGESFYSQNITLSPNQWNMVELTTPYTLVKGESLFIGFQVDVSSTFPIGIDNGPAHSNGAYWSLLGEEWTTLPKLNASLNRNICMIAIVEGESENFVQNDVMLRNVAPPKYIKTNEDFEIQCKLQNKGYQPLTSFDITYKIGNAEPQSQTITGINIQNYQEYNFTIDGLVAEKQGNLPFEVVLSNPNGKEDEYHANDTITQTIFCYNTHIQRNVLLENFTLAKQCNTCADVNQKWDNVLADKENVIRVYHHAIYPQTDDYGLSESILLHNEFRGSGFAMPEPPASMLDRTKMNEYGAQTFTDGTAFFLLDETEMAKYVDIQTAVPAFVTIDVANTYNEEERSLDVVVTASRISGFAVGNDVILHVYLIENGIVGNQGSIENYKHNHLLRRVLAGTWAGQRVIFDPEGNLEKTYTERIPASWNPDSMAVVAFLTNSMKGQVFNAVSKPFKEEPIVIGIDDVENNDNITIYASYASIHIKGAFTEARIYDISGRLIKELNNGQASASVEQGLYIVKVKTGNKTKTQKVMVF